MIDARSTSSLKLPIISKGATTIGKAASLDLTTLTSRRALVDNENNEVINIKLLKYFNFFPQSSAFE